VQSDQEPPVAALCSAVDQLADELTGAVSSAIRIPSVTPTYPGVEYSEHVGKEGAVSRLVGDLLGAAGCDVDLFAVKEGRENCVGVLRGAGDGRSLILNGHVDVVPGGPAADWGDGDPYSGRIADGHVWGRGACDMKGGLLASVYAVIALQRAGVRLAGDLIVEAVVGEEAMEHQFGTSACVERGYRADAAIVAEPSAPPVRLGVVPVTPGVLRFVVTIIGKRTHPAMRGSTIHPGGGGWEIGVNAVDKAFHVYQALRLREEEWGLTRRHPLFAPGQFVIHPGVVVASPRGQLDPFFIADHATLDYIVIYHPDEEAEVVRAEIGDVVATAARLDGWLRTHPPTIEWKHHWPPSRVDPAHPIVTATCRAHEAVTGHEAAVFGWSAVHDGTFLNQAGIPAIACGPGDIRLAHAVDEHVPMNDLIEACKTYAVLAAGWCGLA
jgi:acetylornithine deacetylase/succinyl-diaminopimelate desuccinylase family protein